LRRIAQLKHQRKDLKGVPLRGNVETRIDKVLSGQIDAAVVACAGLNRLGLTDRISAILPPEDFIPAPAQGALAVQVRADDSELVELLRRLDDKLTRIAVEAERTVLTAMQGGCSIPLGAYARIIDKQLKIDAMIADISGETLIRCCDSCPVSQSATYAKKLAEELLEAGGREILDRIRSRQS